MKLRRHFGAAAKHSGDTKLAQRHLLAQCFEQLWCCEQAANIVVRPQLRESLLNYMLLVLLRHFWLAHLDQLNDPTRIEINHEADAAAVLRQVFHGQAERAGAGWTKRQPIRIAWKELLGKRIAESLVIDAKVIDADARLGHTGAATG